MSREEKVLEIVRSSKVGNISCEEAAIQICLLFSVVGRSEQLKCPNCELEYDKEEIEMFRGLCESCRDRAF